MYRSMLYTGRYVWLSSYVHMQKMADAIFNVPQCFIYHTQTLCTCIQCGQCMWCTWVEMADAIFKCTAMFYLSHTNTCTCTPCGQCMWCTWVEMADAMLDRGFFILECIIESLLSYMNHARAHCGMPWAMHVQCTARNADAINLTYNHVCMFTEHT